MRAPRKILVATGFSAGSDEVLERAIEMAKQSAAAVEIVHVLELTEVLTVPTSRKAA